MIRIPIFDLDGTLIDSDAALLDAFVALGVDREVVTFGHLLVDECARLNISYDEYLEAYDESLTVAYPGVEELIAKLDRWAVCSNKVGQSARAEIARLGWAPEIALFAEAFGGGKQLGPVLDAMNLEPSDVVFVGDTEHDRACAASVGVPFVLVGWNPRALEIARPDDVVLAEPLALLDLL